MVRPPSGRLVRRMRADMSMDARGQSSERRAASEPKQESAQADEWVVALRPEGVLPPLFCVCAGGGDVFDYRDLALALPKDQPVYVFGVPPLAAGEGFPSVQRLAAICVAEARKRQRYGPYQLCGHSFGGLVVYEMAALLANEGQEVGLVALIDTLHPAFKRNMSAGERVQFQLSYTADRVAKYARNLKGGRIDRIVSDGFVFVRHRCKHLVWKLARAAFGRPGGQVPDAMRSDEMILVAAWHRYDPSTYIGRLVLLNAADRPPEYGGDRTLGWGKYSNGAIDIHILPGDHYSIMHPPHVQALVERIRPHLA